MYSFHAINFPLCTAFDESPKFWYVVYSVQCIFLLFLRWFSLIHRLLKVVVQFLSVWGYFCCF